MPPACDRQCPMAGNACSISAAVHIAVRLRTRTCFASPYRTGLDLASSNRWANRSGLAEWRDLMSMKSTLSAGALAAFAALSLMATPASATSNKFAMKRYREKLALHT
jgi:hypothetical protein